MRPTQATTFLSQVRRFRPEYIGQIDFYLEALDRDVRKPGENPSTICR